MIPPWLAFLAGLATDLLGGLPVGLNACAFVLVQWIVSDQRRFLMGQSFIMLWIGFVVLSILVGLFQWLLFGLMQMHWTPIKPIAFSVGVGLASFPIICLFLHWTNKILRAPTSSFESAA